MKKSGADPKVKKTLVRNYEKPIRASKSSNVVHELNACSSKQRSNKDPQCLGKENLSTPSLCSSEALATYMTDLKKSLPPPLSTEDLNFVKKTDVTKMTKKLNFHINDKIYKNLVELNSNIEETKLRKPRVYCNTSVKKDLEPNIEDFYESEEEVDVIPKIPVFYPSFKPIRTTEQGNLHRLVASFEVL